MDISQRLKLLNNSQKTVFKLKDLQDLWSDNVLNTKMSAKRMVGKKLLLKLAKNYYCLNKEYNIYELANLIISPSYVSFNSALFFKGVCFQAQNTISSVALFNYEKKIDNKIYKYFTMKKELFFNLEGIIVQNNISFACPERAILDSFYFGFLPNVDNEEKINFTFLKKISQFYPNSVKNKIKKIYGSKV
ncbi:hypothetical protein AMJ49_04310 [Parcubacteria bacterium DG_74_2]|nr:MAG: hypothetical protein AMJ49_04310 [Parcubacteria bacterium DG_74_2]